jgi:SAM-dependent methyltransferase
MAISDASSNAASSDGLISKTLAGRTYALRPPPTAPAWLAAANTAAAVALLPLTVPLVALCAAAMATPLRGTLLSMLVPRIMGKVDAEFQKERRTLLSGISGRVLDVGSGGGAYIKYLAPSEGVATGRVDVVAVEPVPDMHPIIRRAGKDLSGSLNIVSFIEDIPDSENESFDWIILGNVLCEVDDVERAVEHANRLLKPGGRVYFQEHVARRSGSWQRAVQDVVNPVWCHVGGGCNCNRESVRILKGHPCWDSVVDWEYDHCQVMLGNMVLGLAAKKTTQAK